MFSSLDNVTICIKPAMSLPSSEPAPRRKRDKATPCLMLRSMRVCTPLRPTISRRRVQEAFTRHPQLKGGQPHHPQAHPFVIQSPSSTSSAVALFAVLTARHILRNFAVEARSFSATFPLSVRRLSSFPSVSCATLTGDATYDWAKRGFPVRRR